MHNMFIYYIHNCIEGILVINFAPIGHKSNPYSTTD